MTTARAATRTRMGPERCAEGLVRIAGEGKKHAPGIRRLKVRAVPGTVADRATPDGKVCEGVIDVAWLQDPPEDLGAYENSPMRTLKRLHLVARRAGDALVLVSEEDFPRPSWTLDESLEACDEKPFDVLADTRAGLPAGCTRLPAGTVLVPTGEVLPVYSGGPGSYADAFHVRANRRAYWVMPSIYCRGEGFYTDAGEWLNPLTVCSSIGSEMVRLDCEPTDDCWGERDAEWRP